MKLSKRTEWNTEESDLARVLRERQSAGLALADLTASNPTRCGFEYDSKLLTSLADPVVMEYEPDPMGSLHARQAVCRYYADKGAAISPGQVLLTTSTSEAYGYLFKLLCDPGDAIVAFHPSYPLFDFLARAEAVELISASLVYDHGWQIDMEGLRRSITPSTRAVGLVHPNNPTGHFTKAEEARELAAICHEHQLALIVDEVFLDYGLPWHGQETAGSRSSFALKDLGIPVFIVSGISKICGLPQMKAAWLVALGSGAEAALERLEVVADTYLSMNAPVQQALPAWLESRAEIQRQILDRVSGNVAELDRALEAQGESSETGGVLVNRLKIEGGWYAILRIPAVEPDAATVVHLLNLGVLVYPGYFFGMRESGWLVVSLLTWPEDFSCGISLLLRYLVRYQES